MEKITILVPTDFSDCAYNALNYAVKIAETTNAEIIVMHSIQYKDSSFIPPQPDENGNKEIYNAAQKNLSDSTKYIRSLNTDIIVKEILDAGPAELSISSIFDSEKINYVVMGTEGASGLKAVIYGSFTSNVLLIAPCPVFTIPLNAKYNGIKNVVCATEMAESESNSINHSIEFAKKFYAEIIFFNVSSNKKEQEITSQKFKDKIFKTNNYSNIKFELVESNDIVGSIDHYINSTNPDLLITLGKERDLFDTLFKKKLTKKLCMHTKIPLLAFPNLKASEHHK